MTEIVNFLNNVTNKNFIEAEKQFSELLNDRLSTRLANEKVRVADKIFNGATEDQVDTTSETETETEVEDENV